MVDRTKKGGAEDSKKYHGKGLILLCFCWRVEWQLFKRFKEELPCAYLNGKYGVEDIARSCYNW